MESLGIYRKLRHSVKKSLVRVGFYKYPDFIIAGAQKAGTTFLYSVLRQHPQIVEPVDKEAHFFDYDENYELGSFKYRLNFDLSFRFQRDQITFEATPDYLATKNAPERIRALLPNLKLIFILREPISRAISAWRMHHFLFKDHPKYYWLFDPRTFADILDDELTTDSDSWGLLNHLGRSLYGQQLANYYQYFSKEQTLIIFTKELQDTPQLVINKICSFLNLSNFDLKYLNKEDHRFWSNFTKVPDADLFLDKGCVQRLKEYYKYDKYLLEDMIENKVPW